MCSDSFVTAAMKSRIAAHAAAFRKATQSPFGSDDEIGMLNLVDGELRRLWIGPIEQVCTSRSTISSACPAGSAPSRLTRSRSPICPVRAG